jgi:putative FmdB family regulatory protein
VPLYEYKCRACGTLFDKLVPISQADAPQPCTSCGSRETEKRPSAFAAQGGSCGSSPGGSPFT